MNFALRFMAQKTDVEYFQEKLNETLSRYVPARYLEPNNSPNPEFSKWIEHIKDRMLETMYIPVDYFECLSPDSVINTENSRRKDKIIDILLKKFKK